MLSCNKILCNNSDNKLSIDNIYLYIIKVLCDSSHNLIPVVGTKGNFQPVARWYAHSSLGCREAFLLWHSKLKFGHICEIINSTRAKFKQCLRFCKSNEGRARADALANKLLLNDNVCFGRKLVR